MAKAKVQEQDTPPVADPRPMAVRVQASVLKAALDQLDAVIEARVTVPILSHVMLVARDGMINLAGTDLDIHATIVIASDLNVDERKGWSNFSCAVQASSLRAIAGEVESEGTMLLTLADDRLTVTAGRARWTLGTLPLEDFPGFPIFTPEGAFEISASQLLDAHAGVEFAISNEETRYYLNGIFMHPVDLALKFAATDGHRLSVKAIDGPDGAASFAEVIVPKKTVKLIDKLLAAKAKADSDAKGSVDPVVVECAKDKLRFLIGDAEIISKVIDGQFPDYRRVIPSEEMVTASLRVERRALMAAIRRVRVLASKESSAVKCSIFAEKIVLEVKSPETGTATEEVPASADGIGDTAVLGFNHKYWMDALSAIGSDEVILRFAAGDARGPVRIEPWVDGGAGDGLIQVLMPVLV
ncbi:DNA polymerase III subunit beta [Sphingorhabdus pulchriflava]|uniref:Beta sliding clamp n=1 Tax=Sphingorhabdus pulchriflava TaxID=2292257 RepID=A0A371BFW4_9SPHN|nr:DNA polymerase III subunit beta [Sphingorhabdus pulchriflava]RDV06408.1 DNA polymerase III subunit beta [Sphingorhabdus pulchriflava]